MPIETLKLRQELFCQEYVKDANGARAARAVGYAWDTADQQASRLLRNSRFGAASTIYGPTSKPATPSIRTR